MHPDVALVKESLGRSVARGTLFDRFYDIFLKSNPAFVPMFAKTDLKKQKELLRHGVSLGLLYVEGKSIGENGLARIKKTHSKDEMNIDPKLYPYWKRSFLQAVSECDPNYSDEINAAWERTLQKIIDFLPG